MSRTRDDLLKTRHIDVLIGRRLREIRESMGLTQEQVGIALGVSAKSVGNVESGDRIPASRLWQFCGAYGIEVHDVFAGLPDEVGPPATTDLVAPAAAGVWEGDEATFTAMPNDPLVIAITDAAAGLTPLERALALAAVRGIGSKTLRKV
ncbi:MAG: helix-turn-helix domain-containing protein [Brevundimonas sp.]|uniref:helix-turn-helix domain-containing protein n=1 Tax=Brevundimonas sp. TaxID=1871086 RepID=UPI0040332168